MGFADFVTDDIITILSTQVPRTREIILTDQGRKLKDLGSLHKYSSFIQDEEQLKTLLNQTVLRNYWINLCLAILSGIAAIAGSIAAIYYSLEISKYWYFDFDKLFVFLSGFVLGVLSILLIWLLLRIVKGK